MEGFKNTFLAMTMVLVSLTVLAGCAETQMQVVQARKPNTLTKQEKQQGWKLLFDGKTTKCWRGAYEKKFPAFGWEVKNGMLTVLESGGAESRHGVKS